MAIKELGYVVIETAKVAEWREFLTNVAGVMSDENAVDEADHYRIDDRPFRFRIERAETDRLAAAAYAIDTRDALDALAARIAHAGQAMVWGDAAGAAARHVDASCQGVDRMGPM